MNTNVRTVQRPFPLSVQSTPKLAPPLVLTAVTRWIDSGPRLLSLSEDQGSIRWTPEMKEDK
jgi:hypothetical protein